MTQDSMLVAALRANQAEMVAIRHDLHRHPEVGFAEHRTSGVVAERLRAWGLDVEPMAGTGVVGTLKGRRPGARAVGLRADLDALNLREVEGREHGSMVPGVMHACGHDGHTAMLLGAARHLARHPDFGGTVQFIFQPAEEGIGGAARMLAEGLFRRFPVEAVYGMHNWPGIPTGRFATRTGPFMAAPQLWTATFTGGGGHAGAGGARDLSLPLAHFILSAQSIVGREVAADAKAVVSVGPIQAGGIGSANVVPSVATVRGTARAYDPATHDLLTRRLTELAHTQARAFGCTAEVVHEPRTPVLVTHTAETRLSVAAATSLVGADAVEADAAPSMAGEDFAFMLAERPGGFIFIGNGPAERDGTSCALHTPNYDFNDEILALGAAYWVRVVQMELGGA